MHTHKTATDTLNTQTNANESTNEASSTQTNEQWGNTPIWIRGNSETGFYATIGNYRITEPHAHFDEIVNMLYHPKLELIMTLISTMIEANEKFNNITALQHLNTIKERQNEMQEQAARISQQNQQK